MTLGYLNASVPAHYARSLLLDVRNSKSIFCEAKVEPLLQQPRKVESVSKEIMLSCPQNRLVSPHFT